MALIAAGTVAGVWLQRPWPVIAVATIVGVACRPRWAVALAVLVAGLAGAARSNQVWRDTAPRQLGTFTGWACLVADPAPAHGALAAVFEVEGERFQTFVRGSPRRRVANHLAGECAHIVATRVALHGGAAHRAAIRHIVGRIDIDSVGDWSEGHPVDRASNRVRRVFARGAARLLPPDDALFAGLVIGDDRAQPLELVAAFRASGLSHLTAVSGSNVAFVLAAASPLLTRLRAWWRWLVTLLLIAWFAALTRFEPSIVRASVMAAIATTGHLLGREKPPGRVLALAIVALVLVDPMLVWSVGFWLSVAATAGVALLSGPIARLLPGPRWFAQPAGVTLGAQIAVAPVSLLVFGTLPIVSVPANLLAVPVAGLVMLYGLPAGIVAGATGGALATLVQLPSALGTRWVATVARVAAAAEPPSPWPAIVWGAAAMLLAGRALRGSGPSVPV